VLARFDRRGDLLLGTVHGGTLELTIDRSSRRTDLLAEVAGRALGFGPGVGGQVGADMWRRKGLKATPPDPAPT
jgi:hypothetical protein